jgi:hypothetical protein
MILGILGIGLAATSAAALRVGAGKRTTAPRKIAGTDWSRLNETRLNETRLNETRGALLLLEGLKEELFQLEAAKIRGTISTDEYRLSKTALEETVKRALRHTG